MEGETIRVIPPRRYATRSTRTYVELEISPEAFREIRDKLLAAGYDHVFDCWSAFPGDTIDMHGIALTVDKAHGESLSLARSHDRAPV